jgi:hypothetical protein
MRARAYMNTVAKQMIVIMIMMKMLMITTLDLDCGALGSKPGEFMLDLC